MPPSIYSHRMSSLILFSVQKRTNIQLILQFFTSIHSMKILLHIQSSQLEFNSIYKTTDFQQLFNLFKNWNSITLNRLIRVIKFTNSYCILMCAGVNARLALVALRFLAYCDNLNYN